MTRMIQVAVAGDVAEGEELQSILSSAGIESELQPEDEADSLALLVPESSLEAAQDAIEAHDRARRADRRTVISGADAGSAERIPDRANPSKASASRRRPAT